MLVDDVAKAIWGELVEDDAEEAEDAARAALGVIAKWLREKGMTFKDSKAQAAIRAIASHLEAQK